MMYAISQLCVDQRGATQVEYGLIAALVSLAAIGALQALGGSLNGIYYVLGAAMNSATATAASAAAP